MTKRKRKDVVDTSDTSIPKKNFHLQDLIKIHPKKETQREVFEAWKEDPEVNMFLCGSAGTGKTFLSLYMGLHDVLEGDKGVDKIIIIRSAVQGREIGYTPGTLEEKIALYETPYIQACNKLFRWANSYENLKKIGLIEFHSTSFLRGDTFDNAVVLFDECQNASFEEWNTVFTRIGENTKLLVCGDIAQNDLTKKRNDQSGFQAFYDIILNMEDDFEMFEFGHNDIVRSEFVKNFIIAKEKIGK